MSEPAERIDGPTDEGRVTVVGTAHVSERSVDEVQEAIATDAPDIVAVELDDGRYRQLQGEDPEDLDASDLLKGNTVFQFLAYWMLSYVQTRLGEQFDVTPGADMMAAVETAEEYGIDIALVDRDIQQTIQRFWARMTITEKLHLVGGLAFGITDNRVVGIVAGIIVGLFVGPALAIYGGALGVTTSLLTSVTGGVVIAVAVAVAIDTFATPVLDGDDRLIAALIGGLGAGLVGGVFFGLTDGIVGRFLGEFAITVVGSFAIGIGGGVLVGLTATVLLGLVGVHHSGPADGGIDEMDIHDLTDADVVTVMMEEFRQFSPGGAEALIDERDAYIAHQLVALRTAGYHVLAVVGAGHRAGIERYLEDPEALPPMESLVGVEKGRGIPWGKIVGYGVSIAFVAFFLLLAMAGVQDGFLLRLFGAWFLINGVFAAGLAKLAGARWLSAGVGGAVAWMTSINPLLAPGWFTGYMELRHLRVNVGDVSTLNELLSDESRPVSEIVSDMFDVPLFKLIMIVALTNVGSIIASLLFVTYVLPLFAAEIGGIDGVSRLMIDGARNSAELVWGAFA
ncbi:MAG: TraB/GumN family protein [Halobacteriota archaeon]